MVFDKETNKMSSVYSVVGQGNNPEALITKDDDGNLAEIPQNQTVDAIQKGNDLETIPDEEPKGMLSKYTDKFKAGQSFANKFIADGKLSKIAKRKGKKLKIKDLKGKIKKLSKARLKEADPKLFEINFNRRSVARDALDAPVRCGFEAETFFILDFKSLIFNFLPLRLAMLLSLPSFFLEDESKFPLIPRPFCIFPNDLLINPG